MTTEEQVVELNGLRADFERRLACGDWPAYYYENEGNRRFRAEKMYADEIAQWRWTKTKRRIEMK